MGNVDVANPVEVERARRRRRLLRIVLLLLLLLGGVIAYGIWQFTRNAPVDYVDDREHFKYGSVGAEEGHLPYALWKVLPRVFADHLPTDRPGEGYARFGFLTEPGKETPIGFSRRQAQGADLIGLNCAICHVGSVRASPETPPTFVLGMPAQTVDILSYFGFLFRCAEDERFTAAVLIPAIEEEMKVGVLDRLVLKIAIARTREGLLLSRWRLRYLFEATSFGLTAPDGTPLRYPTWGPGRVDTGNAIKALRLGFDMTQEKWVSTNDLPSLWNQAPRKEMGLHWDGNNDSLDERNLSAAMGAGAYPTTVDVVRIGRVAAWAQTLPPPEYPFPVDLKRAEQGKALYQQYCHRCHNFDGAEVGKVLPIDEIGTDPHRFNAATPEFIANANKIGSPELNAFEPDRSRWLHKDAPWRFRHFHKTVGYVNQPLDGVWARAPYLHNGSVPTMYDLLSPPSKRPGAFYRGGDVYDQKKMGFATEKGGRNSFRYDTTLPGNSNGGHVYGSQLSEEEKFQLIEYLKQLGPAGRAVNGGAVIP